MRLVSSDGNDAPVVTIQVALDMANVAGLDLVEIGPDQDPPVCRIMDYGRFKYEQSKKEKEAKRVSRAITQQRQVRLTPYISPNDLESKTRIVKSLLEEGARVHVFVLLRGRQRARPDIASNVLRKVAEKVKDIARLEQKPQIDSRTVSIMLIPLYQNIKKKKSALV